ncbi:MAG: diaminopimelate epimerase [Bacteroidales bacterium]|nr:diaminopimelate epimerase [Bacteroidales bacterium]
MEFEFWKYQGNGNDFVVVDERADEYHLSPGKIRKICDRKLGIGADGLMIVKASEVSDFEMHYYNADGNLSSMCGNGGRCIALFAHLNGMADRAMAFDAFDGVHKAIVREKLTEGKKFMVSLQMADVSGVDHDGKFYFLDTGSPHYVEFVEGLAEIDVYKEGKSTRYSERFSPGGTNVNFVEIRDNRLFVRTYERGVEEETLSCGTGVTAAAIAAFLETGRKDFQVQTNGGPFSVEFIQRKTGFAEIWLHGPAELVFSGVLAI